MVRRFLSFIDISMPAALSSRFFCMEASLRASSIWRSRALRLAFLPLVFAMRALASDNISFSSSSMSMASGLAGLDSGLGSISPGRSRRGSSAASYLSSLLTAMSNSFSYRSKHWIGVRPTMGAMVRHCVGMSLARCSSFSSSSRVHSVFLMVGSSHSYQRALHCFADLRTSSEEMRDHWLRPYFMTAALRISSSVFFHTPPLIWMRMVPAAPAEGQGLLSAAAAERQTLGS
mmetsp:Transcript_7123/g.12266  ORF Transcript_7123/g.12266 Transcript_7123/m.12266 type:complete len:232 (+) Transcript_7123:2304-2999(+)